MIAEGRPLKTIFQSKITKKYLAITLLFTIATLSVIYYITVKVMEDSMREQIEYRNDLMTNTISKKTSFMFDKMVNDIRMISEFALRNSEEDIDLYLNEMDRLVSKNPLYLFIDVLDKDEKVLGTFPNVHHSRALEINDLLDRLKWSKTFYISNVITLQDGRKTIAISYPILNKEGSYQGSIVAYVNLNVLSEYYKQGKIGDKGVNVLVDRNGTIIVHTDEDQIGTSMQSHQLVEFLRKYRYGVWKGYLFHKEMLVSYQPIEAGSFGLIVGEPFMQAMEPVRAVQILLFKGFVLVLFLALLLTLLGTYRIVKPITKLTDQAKQYKEGKRENFDQIKTKDELENLSVTLADMAKELKSNERYLFYILESIPYGIITTDKTGRVVTFNKGAESLTLFKRDEILGKYIHEIPIKKTKEEFLSWKTIQEGKEFQNLETKIYDKEGHQHDIRLYSSLFYQDDTKNIGAIIILRDVSELKKLEEYLKQSERLSSLGQLTAGMAHEIKNPLSIIQAAAEAIKLDLEDPAFIDEMSNDILETTNRLNQLLTELLKLSKGDDTEEQKELVNLVTILDDLLSLFRNSLIDHSIDVVWEYDARQAYVYANESKLAQVFLNIIINSQQAMEEGGSLFVRLKENNREWKVEIEDTGGGIPKTELKWIFNPFFSTKKEGTGLGLSIAYEIVTQHQGRIYASSDDEGTTVTITLPKQERGEN
jgi:PAS domain S-box-containing protein